MRSSVIITLTAALLALPAAQANANPATIGFTCITNNSATNAAIGEAQFTVQLTSTGSSQVTFEFINSGPETSSIAQIYFQGLMLDSIADIVNSTGVAFREGASPGNLPGGSSVVPAFVVTDGLAAGAENPAPKNGVNPGEYVGIILSLGDGKAFDDVLSGLSSGELRIGIHAISIGEGGSEAFITDGGTITIPEPATFGMLILGGLWLRSAKRRK